MIITGVLEKLEQVDKLLTKKGFVLSKCEPLSKIAKSWGSSEYDKYFWHDLTYVKHYGKDNQHILYITLGTTEKLYHLRGKFYTSHLDIAKAWFSANDRLNLLDISIFQKDLQETDKLIIYLVSAIADLNSLRKALNKISSWTER